MAKKMGPIVLNDQRNRFAGTIAATFDDKRLPYPRRIVQHPSAAMTASSAATCFAISPGVAYCASATAVSIYSAASPATSLASGRHCSAASFPPGRPARHPPETNHRHAHPSRFAGRCSPAVRHRIQGDIHFVVLIHVFQQRPAMEKLHAMPFNTVFHEEMPDFFKVASRLAVNHQPRRLPGPP